MVEPEPATGARLITTGWKTNLSSNNACTNNKKGRAKKRGCKAKIDIKCHLILHFGGFILKNYISRAVEKRLYQPCKGPKTGYKNEKNDIQTGGNN